jgi:hypothetical protein
MAKESFFIRARVDTNGVTYAQTSIDLGSYVDALGSAILRIHQISVQYANNNQSIPYPGAPDTGATTSFQLTTQSQSQIVDVTNKSVIATGSLAVQTGAAPGNPVVLMTDSLDVSPQDWTNGYLVGVEQIYLGTDSANGASVDFVAIVLECTVEKMSPSAAMALALSQQ